MRQWLFRYAALDSLLPFCLVLADPLDPAQPLTCAFVQAGASLLRFRDYSMAWRPLDPEAWNCAAVALVLGSCGGLCLVAAAALGYRYGRQARRARAALNAGQMKPCLMAVSRQTTSEGMQCAICLEFCKDQREQGRLWCQLPCNHCFHRACVVVWLRRAHCCPLCRRSSYATDAQPPPPLPWDPLDLAIADEEV